MRRSGRGGHSRPMTREGGAPLARLRVGGVVPCSAICRARSVWPFPPGLPFAAPLRYCRISRGAHVSDFKGPGGLFPSPRPPGARPSFGHGAPCGVPAPLIPLRIASLRAWACPCWRPRFARSQSAARRPRAIPSGRSLRCAPVGWGRPPDQTRRPPRGAGPPLGSAPVCVKKGAASARCIRPSIPVPSGSPAPGFAGRCPPRFPCGSRSVARRGAIGVTVRLRGKHTEGGR
jgi:hypothetical protein